MYSVTSSNEVKMRVDRWAPIYVLLARSDLMVHVFFLVVNNITVCFGCVFLVKIVHDFTSYMQHLQMFVS